MRNLSALNAALTSLFKRRSMADWLRRLEEYGVPAGPVLDIGQMHRCMLIHQALAREMIVEIAHPTAGHVNAIGLPIKFSNTPGGVRRAAPVLGQHTREVSLEHGFSGSEIDQMAALDVIQMPASTKKGVTP
jgi:crotonobetainyl-CoA:carnitine CoA-transferase CaiB-like acyl-CoA transferase